MSIVVLLSTYNGEKYIRKQLDSLLSQTIKPNEILIRDDGSKDDTVNILEEYASKYSFIKYFCGKNKGPSKSFFELINSSNEYDYYALCDQDDVWMNNKLERAIELLNQEDNREPLLYCSRYTLTDKDLNPIESKISKLYNYTDFAHALLYQTAPGCTFVFNNAARDKIIRYDIENNYVMIHDSIIHKVVTMYGKMVLDNNGYIYYRQHGDNEIGLPVNKLQALNKRVKNIAFGKLKNSRSNMAKALLEVYGDDCCLNNKETLEIVAYYRKKNNYKKALMKDKRFKVEGINYFLYKILVLINYI